MFSKPRIVVDNHSDHTLEIEVIEIERSKDVGSLISASSSGVTFSYSRPPVPCTTQLISQRHIFSPGGHTMRFTKRNCTYQVNIFKVNATLIRKEFLRKNEVWTITNASLGNLECNVQPIQSMGVVALVMVLAYCISMMRNYVC